MPDTTLPLASGTWAADPVHSNVGFTIRHLGLQKIRGRFDDVEARLVVGDDLASSSVEATIQLGSVSTGNDDRDAHIQNADFFATETDPTMTFASTGIEGSGETYTLAGDLTLRGVTKPIELEVEFFGTSVFPMDETTRAGFTATGSLTRKDYGIVFNVPVGGDKMMLSDKVALELDIQLVAPSDT